MAGQPGYLLTGRRALFGSDGNIWREAKHLLWHLTFLYFLLDSNITMDGVHQPLKLMLRN